MTKNIAWLTLAAIIEALQLMIIIGLIYSYIPFPFDNEYYSFFPFARHGMTPNRNTLLCRIFVGGSIAMQAMLIYGYRRVLNQESWLHKLQAWIIMAGFFIVPEFYLIDRIWLGPHPDRTREALWLVIALSLAARIFWPEVYAWAWGRGHMKKFMPAAFPDGKDWWGRHQDQFFSFLLGTAIGIQLYLYVFAVGGVCRHQPVWPPAHPSIYVLMAVLALLLGAAGIGLFGRRQAMRAIVESLLAFFLLNALFKLHVYYYQPLLAEKAYVLLLFISLFAKIAWPLIERFLRSLGALILDEGNQPALKIMAAAGFMLFIFLFLYVPDMEAAIARIFMGQQFHSIDGCLMNTAWAYHEGCKLNLDIYNRYGLGMAVITAKLSGLFGGFSYLNVHRMVMYACIVYFIMAFWFLRWWLKSLSLAMAGILILLKMQPFHEETSSFYLMIPTTTVCRHFFDLPFMLMVLLFLKTRSRHFLLAAAALCSVALFYEADTGIYMTIAYYAFLVLAFTYRDIREKIYTGIQSIPFIAVLFILPVPGAVGLLLWTQGPGVFTPLFWHSFAAYLQDILWLTPVNFWEMLRIKEYWIFTLNVWVVLLYTFTMILTASLVYLKKIRDENFFTAVLCLYGLALSNYYINRPLQGSVYSVITPYVFIVCYWISQFAQRLPAAFYKKFYLALLGLCLYALWTTHLTLSYPNVFNFSRNPEVDPLVAVKQSQGRLPYFNFLFIQYPDAFKLPVNDLGETNEDWRTEDDFRSDDELKQYFRKEFNYPEDAALIDRLTRPDQPVPLFSSFEIQILIQAKRKPFFRIFPLVNSRPMRMRLFEVTHMWTMPQLKETLGQLEDKKPPFVFMERIYLAKEIPAAYLYDMPSACALANYIREHYVPYATGKYLVAMKLKGS